ncbi:MAG: hypothetical protein Q9198_009079 [Flavoplaca austrocitrina]
MDNAEWVAWNLPIGTVMTFTNHLPNQPSNPASLEDAGESFDLIGSGQTRSGSLYANHMIGKASAFWWREVDLWQGAVQFFADTPDWANFATIFLCEWPRDTIISMSNWFLEDQISAVHWKALTDRQTMTLYQNPDGSGARYDNIKGWGSFKEIASLGDYGFEDHASAFLWTSISPKKEIIDPIILPASASTDARPYTAYNEGYNKTDAAQSTVVTLKEAKAQSMTVETFDTQHVGMSLNVSQTVKAGVEAILASETTVKLGFTYDYTNTQTVTRTTSKTIAIDVQQTFNVPPWTHFVATVVASVGSCPSTDYNTTATRWYDYAVPNGIRDPDNNSWYKREEMVTFRIGGSLMSQVRWDMEATKIVNPDEA